MKLKTLKMLVKLIEKGSFSVVADELDLTQPAVSMQIKSLEETFNTDLVIREGGEIKLTPAGKVVYHRAKQILDNWEQTKLEVKEVKGEAYGQIVIGASTIPSEYLLPNLLSDFCKKLPEVEVLMEVDDSKEIVDKLDNRKVDVAVVGSKPTKKELEFRTVAEDNLTLIVPKDHGLLKNERVTTNDLVKERILIREEGSGTRKAMLDGLKERGLSEKNLNIIVRLGSTEAIISAVEVGLGISFVSELAAKKAVVNNRVERIKVEDMIINRKIYLAYRCERAEELLIKEFIGIF